ncbi:endonuclease/exonuclease/phosphatase family protein [Actinosynnema sp. NPDC051121]
MSWNLWWRFGLWQERQDAILATLREVAPDVVTLQEVWAVDGGTSQRTMIADALGMHSAGSEQTHGRDGLLLGNAILSRWPIVRQASLDLTQDVTEPRSAVVVEISAPWGTFPLATTHLSWRPEDSGTRRRQARAIKEHLAGLPATGYPPILTGDLNADPASDELRALTGLSADDGAPHPVFVDAWPQVNGAEPGCTWNHANPLVAQWPWPNRRLDYVLVGLPAADLVQRDATGWFQVRNCYLAGTAAVEGVQPSDHYAVVAELGVRPAGSPGA